MIGQTERGVLLLCSTFGNAGVRPLTIAQFRNLSLRASAIGIGGKDPMTELKARDLEHLGYDADDAARIEALLNREQALDEYLARAEALGCYPVTRLSAAYPRRLWEQLGMDCPPVLFCHGDSSILSKPGVALVGSRKLEKTGRIFARRVGRLAAQEQFTLISGGAVGADTEAQEACLAQGGQVLAFVADSLVSRLHEARESLLMVSEMGYAEPFSPIRASNRNRLIHAMGRMALAAQTDYGSGGTWTGCLENIKKGWSPVYVCDDGSPGAKGLIERGAGAIAPDGPQSLVELRRVDPQMSLFFTDEKT